MPEVSIIVPLFNRARYVRACLDAILAQRFDASREVLMVDNNSTDGSAEIVREYPGVILLSESKQGSYAARNLGARHARGKFLMFLDADCLPSPDWLMRLYESLRRPGVALATGVVLPGASGAMLRALGDFEAARDARVYRSADARVYYAHGGNMAVSREVFDRFGPFEERLRGGDTVFAQKVVRGLSCDAAVFVPSAVVHHLEVDGLRSYCRKMYAYGSTRENWTWALPIRSLSWAERFRAYRGVARASGWPAATQAGLSVCLAVGSLSWMAGTLAARLAAYLRSS